MLNIEFKGFINQSSISQIAPKMPSSLSVNRPKRYRSHSLQDQLDAIIFAKEYGDRDAAFCYNTTPRTIHDWRKKEEQIKECIGNGEVKKRRLPGGGRHINHPELEVLLPAWIRDRRKEGGRVTLKAVRDKGRDILKELGRDTIVTKGEIWRLKERNGFSIRRKSTQNQYSPENLIPKCLRFVLYLKRILQNQNFSSIVAMDETPLFSDNMGSVTVEDKGAK